MTLNNHQKPYEYYDWNGQICRLQGDVFDGIAEVYIPGEGFKKGNFYHIYNEGGMLTRQEFETRLLQLTRKK